MNDDYDDDAVEVEYLMRTRGIGKVDAYRILDARAAARQCPAGGRHEWEEQDSGDMFGPIGGGPGTVTRYWIACANCGATPPPEEDDR